MSLLIAALAVALAAAPVRAQDAAPAADDHWDARLTAVTGEVTVLPADGGEESAAEVGMPLEEGDRVVTAAGAEAEVALDGGSLVTVRESSDFKLEKTAKAETSFLLAFGSLLAKIQKLGSQSLQVRTPSAVAAVRGTEFGVEVEGENSHVGVFDEGRVEVGGSGGKEVLTPNQETSVEKGRAPLRAAPLRRFVVQRARMQAQLRRLRAIRRNWKSLPPDRRREMRRRTLERLRELRRKTREERRQLQQRRGEHPNEPRNRRRQQRGRPRRRIAPKAAPKKAAPPRKTRP